MTTPNRLEWTTQDKASWGEGPWSSEPDKIQWVDPTTGLDCLIHRGPSGALCGYVGVAEGHPAFEQHYDTQDVEVHGGLSYSAFCQEVSDESKGICHMPFPGRPHRVWWLGFDCAHSWDVMPKYDKVHFWNDPHASYKDVSYVTAECSKLAAQLAAMSQ